VVLLEASVNSRNVVVVKLAEELLLETAENDE
jgi:hypothetical protein